MLNTFLTSSLLLLLLHQPDALRVANPNADVLLYHNWHGPVAKLWDCRRRHHREVVVRHHHSKVVVRHHHSKVVIRHHHSRVVVSHHHSMFVVSQNRLLLVIPALLLVIPALLLIIPALLLVIPAAAPIAWPNATKCEHGVVIVQVEEAKRTGRREAESLLASSSCW